MSFLTRARGVNRFLVSLAKTGLSARRVFFPSRSQ